MELIRKPIYKIVKDTCLAKDVIIPHGGRIEASSEARRKTVAYKLLKGNKKEETQ